MSTRIFIFFLLLLPHSTYAGEVPTKLFGVTLGMTATRTQNNPAGERTIKRLTGLVPWSRGPRYYYEPEQASEAFPYMISAIIIGVLQCTNFHQTFKKIGGGEMARPRSLSAGTCLIGF